MATPFFITAGRADNDTLQKVYTHDYGFNSLNDVQMGWSPVQPLFTTPYLHTDHSITDLETAQPDHLLTSTTADYPSQFIPYYDQSHLGWNNDSKPLSVHYSCNPPKDTGTCSDNPMMSPTINLTCTRSVMGQFSSAPTNLQDRSHPPTPQSTPPLLLPGEEFAASVPTPEAVSQCNEYEVFTPIAPQQSHVSNNQAYSVGQLHATPLRSLNATSSPANPSSPHTKLEDQCEPLRTHFLDNDEHRPAPLHSSGKTQVESVYMVSKTHLYGRGTRV